MAIDVALVPAHSLPSQFVGTGILSGTTRISCSPRGLKGGDSAVAADAHMRPTTVSAAIVSVRKLRVCRITQPIHRGPSRPPRTGGAYANRKGPNRLADRRPACWKSQGPRARALRG